MLFSFISSFFIPKNLYTALTGCNYLTIACAGKQCVISVRNDYGHFDKRLFLHAAEKAAAFS